VDRPGSVQAELRIGHLGIARSSPDYFPLRVFNAVLGGTFTSRLNLNLRERNGFTYGVRSAFRTRRARGPFVVSTGVGTDVAVAAVRECLAEIDTILADGPTEAEVAAVKDYLIGVFPLTMETTSQLAGQMGNLVTHDLPDDYYARWRDEMAAVGASEAREAGRRCLRPGDLRIVVVGDAAALRGGLEELGVGPVETVDPVALEEEAS
jgi:zinc protease